MSSRSVFLHLEQFFSRYKDNPSAAGLAVEFRSSLIPAFGERNHRSSQLARHLYERAIFLVEMDAVDKGFDGAVLELQRGLYRELEDILSQFGASLGHHFVIVVPVADRPLMLRNFFGSLIEQCRAFGCGSTGSPVSRKVTAFVIDDSRDHTNSGRIRAIAAETTAAGLPVRYVGQTEQSGILQKIPADIRMRLQRLIGDFGGGVPGRKGASVTRNISYLYLRSLMAEFPENTLLWFIDSDEEFKVKVTGGEDIKDLHFINYFFHLDRIFGSSDVEVLTGKVVGDPPVTPAVMINTFLEDILSFLQSVSAAKPDGLCIFHADRSSVPFSAEYHDMTGLFGYQKATSPKQYHCSLTGGHTVSHCFDDFSERTAGFFSGLHPTRTQFYLHDRDLAKTDRARTVYTGNYVIRQSGLGYFIPFAGLGLRMAGPTLGRILKSRLGRRFVSANLPLLHKRTLPGRFTGEFRSGIHKGGESIDLSGEFVRQFWGDVMLFSVEDLTEKGYPDAMDEAAIAGTVRRTVESLWELYKRHQAEVGGKITAIEEYLGDRRQWWNLRPEAKGAIVNFMSFCGVVGKNFGPNSTALKNISGHIEEGSMRQKIIRAIGSFREDERSWGEALKALDEACK